MESNADGNQESSLKSICVWNNACFHVVFIPWLENKFVYSANKCSENHYSGEHYGWCCVDLVTGDQSLSHIFLQFGMPSTVLVTANSSVDLHDTMYCQLLIFTCYQWASLRGKNTGGVPAILHRSSLHCAVARPTNCLGSDKKLNPCLRWNTLEVVILSEIKYWWELHH